MALTTEFIAAVRRQGAIAVSAVSDAEVLSAGDREIQARFIPLCEKVRQNYFIREAQLSATSGRAPVPPRAVTAALRNVQLSLGNGWTSLPQRAMEDDDWAQDGPQPLAYYLDAGSIVLLPTGSAGLLRVRYAARPGRMVADNNLTLAARITGVSVGSTTTTLTLSGVYTGSTTVDVLSAGSAHQQKVLGGTMTALAIPNDSVIEPILVGDYVAAADTSPFVPLPEELMSALVHRVAGTLLRALAYGDEAAQQLQLAEDAIASAQVMLQPRNEGNPQRVTGGLRRALSMRDRGQRWR